MKDDLAHFVLQLYKGGAEDFGGLSQCYVFKFQ